MMHRQISAFTKLSAKSIVPLFGAFLSCALMAGPLFAQADTSGQKVESGKVVKKTTPSFGAPALQVELLDPGDLAIPPDFRVAVYEYLVKELQDSGRFEKVYRSGDKKAAGVSGLVTVRTTAQSFTKGSEKQREVTTFKGATSIKINVKLSNASGQVLMDRDVEGKVSFRLLPTSASTNLDATDNFAKKVAKLVKENFVPAPKS